MRDFYLITSDNLKCVNFVFNSSYVLEKFCSLEGFKNRTIVLTDIAQIKRTFDFGTFYSKHALVSIEIYKVCEGSRKTIDFCLIKKCEKYIACNKNILPHP